MNIIEVENLSVEYYRGNRTINALRSVSVDIPEQETIAVVGESGCGKSTFALSLLGLIFSNEGRITQGEINYSKKNILKNSYAEWKDIRGKEISIVFQDPFASLNPVLKVGEQIKEIISAHNPDLSQEEQNSIALDTLKEVMLDQRIFNSYPHQLSGGQRQRAVIAMAIANRPKILIADEPTTALDVTIQKEILDLLDKLKQELNLTIILITHNLPLAKQRSQKIAVMYAGEIVEIGPKENIFKNPLHPYTQGLIQSIPKIDQHGKSGFFLSGKPPDLSMLPSGCKFHPRCNKVMDICKRKEPKEMEIKGSCVKCFLYEDK